MPKFIRNTSKFLEIVKLNKKSIPIDWPCIMNQWLWAQEFLRRNRYRSNWKMFIVHQLYPNNLVSNLIFNLMTHLSHSYNKQAPNPSVQTTMSSNFLLDHCLTYLLETTTRHSPCLRIQHAHHPASNLLPLKICTNHCFQSSNSTKKHQCQLNPSLFLRSRIASNTLQESQLQHRSLKI